jgi:outer membrane lipoprotein SlyB
MSRNALYALVGVLIVAGGVLGYELYAQRQKTDTLEINVGKDGLKIQKN